MPHLSATPDLAAVLWDMDGTIVDTEPYWITAELDMAAEYGGQWDEQLATDLIGMPLENSARELQQRAGFPGTIPEIIDELIARVVHLIHTQGLPWRPGARELLEELRAAGVPCALVTMSWQRLAEVALAGIEPGTFQSVVTGDQVTHGKPHPEPYLRAIRALEVNPAHCVAIEDSLPGIASATASGARVLAVEAKVPVPAAPGRNRLASLSQVTMADLQQMVGGRHYDLLPAD
ncbi:MAG TPA: HAD family phosphatase [Ruania sp.]|nr:HAD family phosphatase [Ruania sp.]